LDAAEGSGMKFSEVQLLLRDDLQEENTHRRRSFNLLSHLFDAKDCELKNS